jgi:WD40 repeat protein
MHLIPVFKSLTNPLSKSPFGLPFKYDIFISYARRDGTLYARKLKEQLEALDFRPFLDETDLPVGSSLNSTLRRAINKSATLVLIGTEGAANSRYVNLEIDEFFKTGRTIIPVDVQGTLEGASWTQIKERDIVWIEETSKAVERGVPSPVVAASIDKQFAFTRHNVRLQRRRVGIFALFFIVAAIALLLIRREGKAANEAKSVAQAQAAIAQSAIAQAATEKQTAARAKSEANAQRQAALKATAEAKEQQQIALTNAAKAKQQQEIAEERRRVARSQELAATAQAQLATDPELGILLAREAIRESPTAEAEGSLRRALIESRVQTVMRGHTDAVTYATFSPDGTFVGTESQDRTVRVWNVATGQELWHRPGYSSWPFFRADIPSLTFSPDGKLVLVRARNGPAEVCETSSGQVLSTLSDFVLTSGESVFSPDSTRMATAAADNVVRIRDARTGGILLELKGHTGRVNSGGFSSDGKVFVTASDDNSAILWDAASGRPLHVFQDETTSRVFTAVFSAKNRVIVTTGLPKDFDPQYGTRSYPVKIWSVKSGRAIADLVGSSDVVTLSPDAEYLAIFFDSKTTVVRTRTGEEVAELSDQYGEERLNHILRLRFSPDSDRLVAILGDGGIFSRRDFSVFVWATATGEVTAELRGHTGQINSAVFSADGERVLTASEDGTARLWEAETGKPLAVFQGHMNAVNRAAFSPDEDAVLTAGNDGTARLWDASTERGFVESRAAHSILEGHTERVNSAGFSPDGEKVVTSSGDDSARIWQANTGNLLLTLPHDASVESAAFSPSGRAVVTASADGSIKLWDARSRSFIGNLPGFENYALSAAFSPDGKFVVAAGCDEVARVIEVRTGKVISELRGHRIRAESCINGAAFTPRDGKLVVTVGSDGTVRVWNARTGQPVKMLKGHTNHVYGLAFSQDGRFMITGSDDQTARVWEVSTWRTVVVLRGHTGDVRGVALNGNGKWALTISNDGSARLWETSTGQVIGKLDVNTGGGVRIAFHPKNKSVVVVSENTAEIYPCPLCGTANDLIDVAKNRLTRELTDDERRKYLHRQ